MKGISLFEIPYLVAILIILFMVLVVALTAPAEMERVEKQYMESCKYQCEEIGWEYYKSWEGGLWGQASCYCKNLNESPPVLQVR